MSVFLWQSPKRASGAKSSRAPFCWTSWRSGPFLHSAQVQRSGQNCPELDPSEAQSRHTRLRDSFGSRSGDDRPGGHPNGPKCVRTLPEHNGLRLGSQKVLAGEVRPCHSPGRGAEPRAQKEAHHGHNDERGRDEHERQAAQPPHEAQQASRTPGPSWPRNPLARSPGAPRGPPVSVCPHHNRRYAKKPRRACTLFAASARSL